MPRIVSANVTRADGRTFEAKLANLTTSSLFLITREALNFRERVHVALFGVSVEGEVAFAIAEPRLGGVIVFHAPRAVRDTLARHLDEIEVFAVALRDKQNGAQVEEEWLEATTTAGAGRRMSSAKPSEAEPTPVVEVGPAGSNLNLRWTERTSAKPQSPTELQQIPPLGSEGLDLETVDELPLDPDTLVPVEEAAGAPAKKYPPDYQDAPTPQNMPVIGAPDLYKRPPLVVKGKKKPSSGQAPPIDPPPLAAMPAQTAPILPEAQKRTPSRPRPVKREDPTIPDLPHDDLARIQASIRPEPVRLPTPSLGAPPADVELPVLEIDGCTVVFATQPHFRAHYETTMMHGGIIVRADPMLVGQQRALILRIAKVDEGYSLVGRVAFNGKDGSVGFMIESFLHHRPMLEAIANRTAAAAR